MYSSKRSTVSGSSGVLLRQRRHLGRKVVDEGRLDQPSPRRAPRRSRSRSCRRRGRLRPRGRARRASAAAASRGRAGRRRRPSRAELAPTPPRAPPRAATARANGARQRDLMLAEGDLIGADRLRAPPSTSISSVIAISALVVGVGLVELHHRELGVVLRRNPLVPEVAVDLEHLLEAADGQPLQVQLRRDAQVELHVERVVVRDERPRERAAGNRLHHRRLDLEIAARGHELADRRRRRGCAISNTRRESGIDDQIEIALAIADLDVGQAVPFLGQRHEALGEEVQARRPDRQLVGLGAEQPPLDADPVAEIEQLEDLEVELAAARPGGCRPGSSRGRRRGRGSSPCRSCGSPECGRWWWSARCVGLELVVRSRAP